MAIGTGHPRRPAAAYRAMDRTWALAAGLLEPAAEQVRIRSGRTILPGWLLRPRAAAGQPAARRPTVIFTGGADTQHIGAYVYGAAEAVALGYNALLVEGPGQGSLLHLRGTGLRPDWETVITPAVHYLQDRPDVDPRRIALIGWGLGGALAARAAAREPRLAALVLDPGVTHALATLRLPAPLVNLAESGIPGRRTRPGGHRAQAPGQRPFRRDQVRPPVRSPFSALVRELGRYSAAAWLPDIPRRRWSPSMRRTRSSRARAARRSSCCAVPAHCMSSAGRRASRCRRTAVTRSSSTGWAASSSPAAQSPHPGRTSPKYLLGPRIKCE